MISVVDHTNRPVRIGREIARGGEGAVHDIPDDPSVLGKIYLRPVDSDKASKLAVMASIANSEVLKFSAWPTKTLHSNGKLIGILMPRAPAMSRAIHELYTPKTRIRDFPSANWQFLVNVAANVTRGFAVLHQHGHIVGDVNHGNILVAPNGTTVFIDCDSFQIKLNGKVYLCEVGVSTYTPPELQNKSFDHVVRTQNHDCFGLAILLFHLLFMGRHPFAGRYSGSGYMPIERAIGECRFAFGRLAANMLMSPPPDSLLLTQISAVLGDAFERAFSSDAARGGNRPSALEWLSLLVDFQRQLSRCKAHKVHVYYSRLSSCPWCPIENRGVILFIDVDFEVATSLNIEELWKRIINLQPLGNLPPIPTVASSNLKVVPAAEARGNGRKRKLRVTIGIVLVVATIGSVIWLSANGLLALILIGTAIGIAFRLPAELQHKRAMTIKHYHDTRQSFQQLQTRYANECAETLLTGKIKTLAMLKEQYSQLPVLRRRKLQDLEKNKYQLQLNDFLDRISLSDARIASIGLAGC